MVADARLMLCRWSIHTTFNLNEERIMHFGRPLFVVLSVWWALAPSALMAAPPVDVRLTSVFDTVVQAKGDKGDKGDKGGKSAMGAPGPIVGAGLPFLLVAGGVYWFVRRRRGRTQSS